MLAHLQARQQNMCQQRLLTGVLSGCRPDLLLQAHAPRPSAASCWASPAVAWCSCCTS